MKNERNVAIALVLIIIILLSALVILTNEDFIDNLFSDQEKTIQNGDYVDVHYIGKYENGEIFTYSYDYLNNKTGESPLNIFVTTNSSILPDADFNQYSNKLTYYNPYSLDGEQQYYITELIEGLIGMDEGETKTIGPISPINYSLVEPEIGDLIDLSILLGINDTVYSVYNKADAVPIPEEYVMEIGNISTTLYTLRQDFYKIGDSLESMYTFWENSSTISKINETLIWIYINPTTIVGENFTWTEISIDDLGIPSQLIYPTNSSAITSINETTIVITHTPEINSTIQENYAYGDQIIPGYVYTVKNMSNDLINLSYPIDAEGNLSYININRTSIIQRNQTQSIIMDPIPAELLEPVLSYIRQDNADFNLSCSPFTKTIYLEVEVVNLYKD